MELRPNIATKYLETYAESEVTHLSGVNESWSKVLVIPLYKELDLLAHLIQQIAQFSERVLVVIVLNAKSNDTKETHKNSRRLLEELTKGQRISDSPALYLEKISEHSSILAVDRVSEAFVFPPDQGVGLARKIGCDIALQLISQGCIEDPWIFTSDADVMFPSNYFSMPRPGYAAVYSQFRHVCDDETRLSWLALQAYEISLRHYRLGLASAGSPYSMHTIGSTISIDPLAYAAVRGFPKRLAGEDFYILNKLAKVGPVSADHNVTIKIKDRPSDRVPFGTGAAVDKITTLYESGQEYRYYDPRVFSYLKAFLKLVPEYFEHEDLDTLDREFLRQTGQELDIWEQELGIEVGLRNALAQAKDTLAFQARFHIWFDALKTLRFVHIARDRLHPSVELGELYPSSSLRSTFDSIFLRDNADLSSSIG